VGPDSLLREAPSVSCLSAEYRSLRPLFLVLLVTVVAGLPVFFVALLYRTARGGEPHRMAEYRARYGILFEMFEPEFW
jgi:hypothetical protein